MMMRQIDNLNELYAFLGSYAYNKFLSDNRVPVKGYDEWLEYVEDIPDELLRSLA